MIFRSRAVKGVLSKTYAEKTVMVVYMQKELPVKKNIRLANYGYSNTGYYFVTICVKDRHEMLGRVVVGDGLARPVETHIVYPNMV